MPFYCYGNEAKYLADEAKKAGIARCIHFQDKASLAELLRSETKEGDILWIKGSRGMKLEDVISGSARSVKAMMSSLSTVVSAVVGFGLTALIGIWFIPFLRKVIMARPSMILAPPGTKTNREPPTMGGNHVLSLGLSLLWQQGLVS